MDTSETYTKMCEKAREIQKPTPCIEDGDYYWWSVTDKVQLSFTEYHAEYRVHHPEPWDWLSGRRIIWLPRQDQLQEMVAIPKTASLPTMTQLTMFYQFWQKSLASSHSGIPYFILFTSREQLEMAFVMKEKYKKVWDGDDWIK